MKALVSESWTSRSATSARHGTTATPAEGSGEGELEGEGSDIESLDGDATSGDEHPDDLTELDSDYAAFDTSDPEYETFKTGRRRSARARLRPGPATGSAARSRSGRVSAAHTADALADYSPRRRSTRHSAANEDSLRSPTPETEPSPPPADPPSTTPAGSPSPKRQRDEPEDSEDDRPAYKPKSSTKGTPVQRLPVPAPPKLIAPIADFLNKKKTTYTPAVPKVARSSGLSSAAPAKKPTPRLAIVDASAKKRSSLEGSGSATPGATKTFPDFTKRKVSTADGTGAFNSGGVAGDDGRGLDAPRDGSTSIPPSPHAGPPAAASILVTGQDPRKVKKAMIDLTKDEASAGTSTASKATYTEVNCHR